MPDNKMSVDKMSFIFGLILGIAIISVGVLLSSNLLKGDAGKVAGEEIVVKEEDNKPAPIPEQTVAPVPGIKDTEYVKGNENATVEIIEYSDFECPFCFRHKPTMDQIYSEYKDKVKIVFRHFPLSFHQNAQKSAEASECAGEQGKFWEMYDKLFKANEDKNMTVAQYKKDAVSLGLKATQFNTCLDDGKYADKIKKDMTEGAASGVKGTPATFINGQLVSGAVPVDQFKQIIDSLLE